MRRAGVETGTNRTSTPARPARGNGSADVLRGHLRRPLADAEDALRVRLRDQRRAVRRLELPQHRADVVLDALPAQVELRRELHSGDAGGDAFEHLRVQLAEQLA